ncbi:hypothetical protein MUN78_04475 [Leucobacter allii]|uniref:Pilus assembly protein TadB n=1 Tax=Leucobacter allii TaxID=2932247 RepID=A0ABY4FPC8_9MICO|nr:hypothetical protein [Leucobacter allii]UOQ58107.1 hypothetical protein MUN78_04475 [Leucobacter allii]
MEIEWGAVATVAGAVLVFISTVWGLRKDDRPMRKLERLVALRKELRAGSEAALAVEKAIDVLAARVRDQAYPIGKERVYALIAACAAYAAGALMLFTSLKEDGPGKWFGLGTLVLGVITYIAGMSAPARDRR